MPTAPNDPASALCDIGDLAEDVLILMHRMNRAESIFNQMLGINITALSMSDIAERIGNMLDGQQSMSFAGGQATVPDGPSASYIVWTGISTYTTPSSFAGITESGNSITFTQAGTYLCLFRTFAYRPSSGGANYVNGNAGLGITSSGGIGPGGSATSAEFSGIFDAASTTAMKLYLNATVQFTASVNQQFRVWIQKTGTSAVTAVPSYVDILKVK
jgi:hypothetical protein